MPTAARADHGRTTGNHALPLAPRAVVLFGILSLFGPSLLMPATKAATLPGTAIVNVASVTAALQGGSPPAVSFSNRAVTVVSAASLSGLTKTVIPSGTVHPGARLGYTLGFENASPATLTGVVLADPLDPFIASVSDITTGAIANLGPGGGRVTVSGVLDPAAWRVVWTLPSLPPGFRGEVSFRAELAAAIPDETIVRNAFTGLSDQDPAGSTSPEATSAVVAPSLALSLSASRDRVEVGDLVGFTIHLTNLSPSLDLSQSAVVFTLPRAFRYNAGTLRVAGRRVSGVGPRATSGEIRIAAGDLPHGESREITLVGIAAASARRGAITARARASATTPSGIPVEALPAEAPLSVVEGAFASEAVVAGKVFVDTDADGVPSASEPSVPGVRLYLEDGTEVLTDIAGKYHFEGIPPGMHVLKIDPETAPPGLRPEAIAPRSSGSAGVQFIDLGAVDLFKANFALRGEPEAYAALRVELGGSDRVAAAPAALGASGKRGSDPLLPPLLTSVFFEDGSATLRREAEGLVEAYAQGLKDLGRAEGDLRVSDLGASDPDLGLERAKAFERALAKALGRKIEAVPAPRPAMIASVVPASNPGADRPAEIAAAATATAAPGDPMQTPSLSAEEILKALPQGLFVLSPKPGQVILDEFTDVEVAFPTGRHLHLAVNGNGVGEDRIGVRMQTSRSGMSLYRFMGLRLLEGENTLAAEMADEGASPQRIELRVDRVGSAARISLRGEGGAQPADGKTPGRVIVEVRDAKGHPVLDGTLVTIEPLSGSVLGIDADPRMEGFQARTTAGQAVARLSPADRGETRVVAATADRMTGKGEIRFGPHLRDWIVAGLGEAGWSGSGAPATGSGSGFGAGDPFGDPGASSRLAFFAKGKVGEESLLSVSFDSSRARDETRLYRAQDPASHFPIYGDSSAQAYDLESQGKLAVRWERDRTMLMYGDFQTGLGACELARYDRTLSGGLAHVELPSMSVQAFGAQTRQREVRDAFGAGGSSGPYRMSRRPIVAYSEKVTLEVRDRLHTERVLATSSQSRFTDYDIDYTGGTILFRGAIDSQDAGFNPVTIVVTYETLDSGRMDLVAGGRIGWHPTARFDWGTTAVHEERAGSPFTLTGMDLTFRPFAGAAVTTEYARAGDGGRVSGALGLRFNAPLGRRATVGAYIRDIPTGFGNPSMTGASEVGTLKEGIELRAGLPDGSRVLVESFRQEQRIQGIEHRAASLGWEKPDGPITWQAGAKALGGTTAAGAGSGSSGLLNLGVRSRISRRFDASALRQQIVAGESVAGYPTRTDLGAGYRFNDQVRGFVRHEIDEGGTGNTSRTLLGVEGALNDTTTLESRYTMEDALNGARGYATMGLRTRMPIDDLWSADFRAERSETLIGAAGSDFTSLSAGAEYLPGRTKFTSRYEVRFGTIETRHLLTTAGAVRLTQDLSLFTRQRLNLAEPDTGASRLDADGLVGLAYRPVESDRFNWLGRLQATRGESLPGGGTTLSGAPEARGVLGIFEINAQPRPRWHLLARYGGRYASDTFDGSALRSYTELWEGRCLADAGRRVTAGLSLRLLRQPATETALTGAGVESGFMVAKDLWLVGGYNFTGFSDRRFPDGERRSQGPFLTLRFKFDESLLAGLRGSRGKEGAAESSSSGERGVREGTRTVADAPFQP